MSDDRSIVCLFKALLKLNCYWKDDYQSHSINQPALVEKKTKQSIVLLHEESQYPPDVWTR